MSCSVIVRHISNVPQARGWERKIAEGPPCVVLASPGMLQSGTSRELFELWAPDSRNGLIVTGYSVEGTPARVSHPSFLEASGSVEFRGRRGIFLVYICEAMDVILPSRVIPESSTCLMRGAVEDLLIASHK
jgi:Cft2 family RNA processing exonuclease